MGCLRSIGCLVVALAIAAAAWFFRDTWLPYVRGGGDRPAEVASPDAAWQPVSVPAAERGRAAVRRLTGAGGPDSVELTAAELASYVLGKVVAQLPPSAGDIQAAVEGERLRLRATVDLAELGGDELGPLGSMLSSRETVELAGTLQVVRPGLGQFRVHEVRVRDFTLPSRMVPRLVGRLRRGPVPDGVAPDAFPLEIPAGVGDVRLADGKVTLYRSARS